jgi:hypothetical protein
MNKKWTIHLDAVGGQCLKRRIGSKEVLERETAAYVSARNARQAKVLWGFSVHDAMVKMKRVYP